MTKTLLSPELQELKDLIGWRALRALNEGRMLHIWYGSVPSNWYIENPKTKRSLWHSDIYGTGDHRRPKLSLFEMVQVSERQTYNGPLIGYQYHQKKKKNWRPEKVSYMLTSAIPTIEAVEAALKDWTGNAIPRIIMDLGRYLWNKGETYEPEAKLRAKCNWERMSRPAVIHEWGDPRTWK
jgi:hypothetical protein